MKVKRDIVPAELVPVLGVLHRLEGPSLFRYLAESPAYVSPQAGRWMPLLKGMGVASHERLATLEKFLEEGGGGAAPVHYPSNFASLHYLSMNYLRGRLLADKQALVAGYLRAAESADAMDGAADLAVGRFIREAAGVHQSDLAMLESLPVK